MGGSTAAVARLWVVSEMWCACGKRWVCVAPLKAFRYRCPDCGAWGEAPVWGGIEDLKLEISGERFN